MTKENTMPFDNSEALTGTEVGSNGILSNDQDKRPIVPLTPTGRPVNPDIHSIDRKPLSSLPEEPEAPKA
jgi:hypothetical protein